VGASMAIGPVGRQAEAALRLGVQGGAMCYSYSMSSGIFAGKPLLSGVCRTLLDLIQVCKVTGSGSSLSETSILDAMTSM